MGASQSNEGDLSPHSIFTEKISQDTRAYGEQGASGDNNHRLRQVDRQIKENKGKPSPPGLVKILGTTHSSVTLSWQLPRRVSSGSIIAYTVEAAVVGAGKERQWRVLTKSCQGLTYEARYLEPSTSYIFRVRSENVYSVSKPSPPSDLATTKMFETPTPNSSHSGDGYLHQNIHHTDHNFRRYRSFNMHLEGGVKSLLNHSDIITNPSSSSSSSSHISSTTTSGKSETSHSLLRSNFHRTSLPHNRKIYTPILLPGTGNSSIKRLRESHHGRQNNSSDIDNCSSSRNSTTSRHSQNLKSCHPRASDSTLSTNSVESLKKMIKDSGKGLTSKYSSKTSLDDTKFDSEKVSSNEDNTDKKNDTTDFIEISENKKNKIDAYNVIDDKMNKNTDDIYKLKEELKKIGINSEQIGTVNLINGVCARNDPQQRYYESLEGPWVKDISLAGVSEQILAAPFCDDVKLALYAKNLSEEKSVASGLCERLSDHATDFRTLRSVLHSDSVFVKMTKSLPDVVNAAVARQASTSEGQLTAIADIDEDSAVRVTTL